MSYNYPRCTSFKCNINVSPKFKSIIRPKVNAFVGTKVKKTNNKQKNYTKCLNEKRLNLQSSCIFHLKSDKTNSICSCVSRKMRLTLDGAKSESVDKCKRPEKCTYMQTSNTSILQRHKNKKDIAIERTLIRASCPYFMAQGCACVNENSGYYICVKPEKCKHTSDNNPTSPLV
ncbi:MAG: hypothetical protein WAX04_12055 [Oscillospiraceae bacterium]